MKVEEALFLIETPEQIGLPKLAEAAVLLAAEVKRLRGALQMIADQTLVPDAFPDSWDSYSESEQLHISALLIAECAIDPAAQPAV